MPWQSIPAEATKSYRHEVRCLPLESWTTGLGKPAIYTLLSYHDLILTLPEALSISARALVSPLEPSALLSAVLAWSGLPHLRLHLDASCKVGDATASWAWAKPGAVSLGLGATGSW